jgi:hypothetical protein
MFALFGARPAAVRSACERHFRFKLSALVAIAATGFLAGCLPATTPLVGADPADPSAKVASVGYRSAIAPYTSMRPSAPAPWRQRNDNVAPQPKSDQ